MPETPESQSVRRVTRTMSSAKAQAKDNSGPQYIGSGSDSSYVVDIAGSSDSDDEVDLTGAVSFMALIFLKTVRKCCMGQHARFMETRVLYIENCVC